jgi:hypothetical protein
LAEKLAAFQAATAGLTKETSQEEAKQILRAAQILILDLTPTEEEDIFADLPKRCPLPTAWLKAFRREINKQQKKIRATGRVKADEVTLTALLPGLVDLVEYEGAPAFLMKTADQGVLVAAEWEGDGVSYAPPPREQIPWLLPRADEVRRWYDRNEAPIDLYNDLLVYHKGISELPSSAHYDLLVAWEFQTYLLEPYEYSPEICLYAVPERGKSRTGKGMIYVARRGVHVESLRDAYLVRLANNFQATIFFDVMNLWKKTEKTGCEDIILGRFERGLVVPRVLYPERERTATPFSIKYSAPPSSPPMSQSTTFWTPEPFRSTCRRRVDGLKLTLPLKAPSP